MVSPFGEGPRHDRDVLLLEDLGDLLGGPEAEGDGLELGLVAFFDEREGLGPHRGELLPRQVGVEGGEVCLLPSPLDARVLQLRTDGPGCEEERDENEEDR